MIYAAVYDQLDGLVYGAVLLIAEVIRFQLLGMEIVVRMVDQRGDNARFGVDVVDVFRVSDQDEPLPLSLCVNSSSQTSQCSCCPQIQRHAK